MLRTRAGGGDTRTDKKSFVPQLVSVLTAITAVLAILISWLTFKEVVAAMRMLFFRIERKPGDEQIDLRRVCLMGVEMPAASWMTPNSSGRNSTEPI